jgi:diguanylate cyclase (GGDEF)-like protein
MVALVSAPLTIFTALTVWMLLVRPGGGSALQRLIGWNDLLFFVVIGVRTWTAAVDGGIGVFSSSAVHTLTYVTGFVVLVVNGFGFLLLCKERDDRRLEELATRDGLTGLLNRRAFFERTELARTLSARLHKPLALMMLDIDHFKRLNDRFGHAAGDEALCVFARTVGAGLRDHDIVARLGGEEFALVMPGTSLSGAVQAAERVRAAVAAAPVLADGQPYALTVSIGVVLVAEREQLNGALARADQALYAAKSGGRNRVACGEVEQQLVWE